ncbi:MAG: hypothetical protein CMJ83_09260 [Planctomycetes bacterium]|nr:hypothetical protein [Planctomycetota bacterium]
MTPSRTSIVATRERGITLIMIVLIIGAIFIAAGVALPEITSRIDNQTSRETSDRISDLQEAMTAYTRDLQQLPTSLDHLGRTNGTRAWRGPYVQQIIQGWAGQAGDYRRDNWNRTYRWRRTNRYQGTIISSGPNGRFGDSDDLRIAISVFDVLRSITMDRLDVVNIAISNYNARFGQSAPLWGSAAMIVRQLQLRRFLPRGPVFDRDAFGAPLRTVGRPVTAFSSRNTRR